MHQLILRLIALCMLASIVQCGPDAIGVRVHVIGVTPDIHSLHVNTVLDGKPAMQGAKFTQQLSQFTIKVPTAAIDSGELAINVAGLGIDHCRVSAGRRDIQVSKDTPYVELDVSLVPSKICTLLDKITPSFASPEGGITLQLEGQNFAEGASVTVDGVTATDVVVMDSGRLTAVLPARPGAFGRVPVVVSTPDGQIVSRNDLFSYYAKHLDLTSAIVPAGMGPASVAVGDFNGDKKLDLAVVNDFPSSNSVSVVLGDGMGGFGPPSAFTVNRGPKSVAVGDFNGDQRLDIVAANFSTMDVSVLLGNGSGGFSVAKNFTVASYATSVAVGDFNRDQILDLAVGTDSSSVSVLLGTGMGSFANAMNIATGMSARSVSVGDLNGDQNPDIAVANYGSNNVSVLQGDGKGLFTSANFPAGSKPNTVTIGDFNKDLKPDLIVGNDYTSNVNLLLSTGNGGFGAPKTFDAGPNPYSLAVGDFNGDQNLDLAVITNTLSVLLGDGKGNLGTINNFSAGRIYSPSVAAGDFNGDQRPDLAVTSGESIIILTNTSQ